MLVPKLVDHKSLVGVTHRIKNVNWQPFVLHALLVNEKASKKGGMEGEQSSKKVGELSRKAECTNNHGN